VPTLTPEDRVVLWRKTIESTPKDREVMLKVLAREALDTAGAKLDLYHDYEDAFAATFALLDESGYLGRDDLRQAFEEADTETTAAALFVALVADYLRRTAEVDRLEADARIRAVELSHYWRDLLAERPAEEEGWLSVAQVAAHYGVTPQAVYKWIREDKIEYEQRPGGSYRIRADQIERSRPGQRQRVKELQQRLLERHKDVEPVEDDELVAEIRSRRQG